MQLQNHTVTLKVPYVTLFLCFICGVEIHKKVYLWETKFCKVDWWVQVGVAWGVAESSDCFIVTSQEVLTAHLKAVDFRSINIEPRPAL